MASLPRSTLPIVFYDIWHLSNSWWSRPSSVWQIFFIKADKILASKHFDEAFFLQWWWRRWWWGFWWWRWLWCDDSSELKPVRRTSVADRLRCLRNESHSVSDPVSTSFQVFKFSTIFVSGTSLTLILFPCFVNEFNWGFNDDADIKQLNLGSLFYCCINFTLCSCCT